MLVSLIVFVVLAVFGAYFASNNLEVITLNVLGYPLKGTTGTLLVSALGLGVVLGILMMLPALISRSWAVVRHRRRIQDLQDEQDQVRRSAEPEEVEED